MIPEISFNVVIFGQTVKEYYKYLLQYVDLAEFAKTWLKKFQVYLNDLTSRMENSEKSLAKA